MTADDMWKQLVKRHPSFKDEENLVSLRARGLRALIDQAWEEGHETAVKKSADIFTNRSPFHDLFSKFSKN